MENIFYYETPIGKIVIAEEDNTITNLDFVNNNYKEYNNIEVKETSILQEANRQLSEYFKKERKYFDLPLSPSGTNFQKNVWNALQAIPYGRTWSYKEVAEKVGSPKAARAVGMANNKNPISIIIPCHRVIGASGKLVGYGGGLHIKEFLLDLEKIIVQP